DMPGVGKDGIEVLLEGNELTIVGRRSQEKEEGQYLIRESRPRNYRRTFVLDPEIDTSRIKARIEQGVLTIHLPKADAVKPRRIEISG
ncbi:MAG: Hsp20/alpha crystallin family protein, partial [Verrucomicrobia bacterium]|nr:Hsp20/alpha crystallin family protein [Verrucomicrobiota bacterium]